MACKWVYHQRSASQEYYKFNGGSTCMDTERCTDGHSLIYLPLIQLMKGKKNKK